MAHLGGDGIPTVCEGSVGRGGHSQYVKLAKNNPTTGGRGSCEGSGVVVGYLPYGVTDRMAGGRLLNFHLLRRLWGRV